MLRGKKLPTEHYTKIMTHHDFQTMRLNSTPTDTYTRKIADLAYCKKCTYND